MPAGTQTRIGIDRDLDGVYDRDELDGCSDPADPASQPGDWTDLGNGLAGTHGVPVLAGCGTLAAGDLVTLTLANARENASAFLVIGLAQLNAPFKGGTLVPSPDVIIGPLGTGAVGQLALGAPMAAGLPPGFAIHFQDWLADPAGVQGYAASNGLRGITP